MAQPERQGQALFFQRVRLDPRMKDLPIFAIPNGGSRNPIEAKNLKRSGVTSGVPDICCAVEKPWISNTLWMEAKIGKGKVSEAQEEMHEKLRAQANQVSVVSGKTPVELANNLWTCLCDYLDLPDK